MTGASFLDQALNIAIPALLIVGVIGLSWVLLNKLRLVELGQNIWAWMKNKKEERGESSGEQEIKYE